MFVLNPDPFLLPSFKISPFKTSDITKNSTLPNSNVIVDYFNNRFGHNNWMLTINGREAIEIALSTYNLVSNDCVSVITTTQNFYISSCVTKTIERYCGWSRKIEPETKLIFVNHEFGYPYEEMDKLEELNIPIVEDCATTFFSDDINKKLGKYGDFTFYSFPKFFPIQIGGLLVSNRDNQQFNLQSVLTTEEERYIKNVLSYYIVKETKIKSKRKFNLDYTLKEFNKIGFEERLFRKQNIYPSCLLLNNNGIIKDLPKLKLFLTERGIQSSVFYGEDAFFVPCNQSFSQSDIDYIVSVVKYYINNNQ